MLIGPRTWTAADSELEYIEKKVGKRKKMKNKKKFIYSFKIRQKERHIKK